jgi:imidazoleglycerol phosphate synthase glutamine amidotransferase subunit HisH
MAARCGLAFDMAAAQFHSEKSQKIGLQLLKNFVELAK